MTGPYLGQAGNGMACSRAKARLKGLGDPTASQAPLAAKRADGMWFVMAATLTRICLSALVLDAVPRLYPHPSFPWTPAFAGVTGKCPASLSPPPRTQSRRYNDVGTDLCVCSQAL